MKPEMKPSMQRNLKRRAFLAASALSIPTIAFARTSASGTIQPGAMEFEDLMKQAGRHLKSMRDPMQSLDAPGSRSDAAFYANQITILLAQCIATADQAPIPERSQAKYAEDKDRFTTDLRIKLGSAASASVALCRQLLLGNDQEANSLYDALRNERKQGHDEFEEEH